MLILSRSSTDTFNAGKKLGEKLAGGSVVLLSGFLGAGKTVFAKGIAAALDVQETVVSPTFTLMNEYAAAQGLTLYHIDAYRIACEKDLAETGIADTIGARGAVTLIEWHENIPALVKGREATHVTLTVTHGDEREITIEVP
ncbi:MAG: tRNA (adenosine(37)-N6)-threonylcarbamoyltransferase complex ATPase subunit type 1 TsaE [Firmicutes bacterium]|nr:tRNA (adenosine(37)-N6)-threonylcarbamoyltransferase complex ATPase subunit type 1 TsaE [Bacillota bacterium]